MTFEDVIFNIVIPGLAGGILGPIYARWFRWWKRSRKQKKSLSVTDRQ